MLRKFLGVTAMAVAPLFVALPGPAVADSVPAVVAGGQLTLYSGPNGGGVVRQFRYADCPAALTLDLPPIASFDNTPPTGCVATLVTRPGDAYRMCVGRANVPARFQESTAVRVVPGTSTSCPTPNPHARRKGQHAKGPELPSAE